jgi:hypothetical protein
MGIDYVYKPEKRLVIVVWDGVVNLDQWQAHLRHMFADAEYPLAKYHLTDLRFSSIDPSITEEGIRRAVDFMGAQGEKIIGKKFAIVAGDEWERPKFIEPLLQALSTHPIVFNDLVTACLWLGADVAEAGNTIKEIRSNLRRIG